MRPRNVIPDESASPSRGDFSHVCPALFRNEIAALLRTSKENPPGGRRRRRRRTRKGHNCGRIRLRNDNVDGRDG